jgi:N-dimethylarginine dimethylaminohydrolase
MSVTFLMSYPGTSWQIRGGENFRSETRSETNPKRAFKEWLALCDAITRAGGHILVMPPAAVDPPLTGMVYTANAGHLFSAGGHNHFLVSNMSVAHRQKEREPVAAFATQAGLTVENATQTWEGQADLQLIAGNRYIATYGVRSVKKSIDQVRPLLPQNARLLELQIRHPFFHGDTCLDAMVSKGGHEILLAHGGALVDFTIEGLRGFVGDKVDVIGVDQDDALAYACNSLCVNGTVLMPEGVSPSLRGQLMRRGFTIEELAFPELFGKGGGGPRCLVNELRGMVVTPGAPDYASRRDALVDLCDRYPEKIEIPPASPPIQ